MGSEMCIRDSDVVYGSKYADVITSKGDDQVFGGKGNDIITSTTGSTDIFAGSGNDIVNITSKGGGFDDVDLEGGDDQVNLTLKKADDDYSFVIRDLRKGEFVDIDADAPISAKVKGSSIEVKIDGSYVGSIDGYVDDFTGLSLYEASNMGLMNMDKIEATASTKSVEHWKDDLIAASALVGWGEMTKLKDYKKFTKSGSVWTKNLRALSEYMYDGEVVDEFVLSLIHI